MIAYPDSVKYLYALGNELKTAKLGLERIVAVLAAMGNPERAFESVHVAGTNGKGSTCAMIASSLRAAGYRTGLFTSPHLVEPTERIRVEGADVTPAEFAEAFDVVHAAAGRLLDSGAIDLHPTYFEAVTAMAFEIFRRQGVERAVIEVGLGGRLDATNVITPLLSVITPVDLDHEAWLGKDIETIAGEKAGIIKTGVPVVVSSQRPEVGAVIRRKAAEKGAPVVDSTLWSTDGLELEPFGCRYWARRGQDAFDVRCPLAGEHQVDNSRTAVAALNQLGIGRPAIEAGIAAARWPGRLERLSERPDLVVDGAHNPAGVRALANYIRRFHAERKVWLIYATMRDKSVAEIGDTLSGVADEIIVTAADSARALRPEALAEIFDHPRVRTAPRLADALEMAKAAAPDDIIFVTGSLFLVGEAKALLA